MLRHILLCSSILLFSTHSYAQMKINDFQDAEIYFNGLFDSNSEIDDYGNISIDMGSASAGRVLLRITDVNITMTEKKERPGCADICPPMILINFECRKSKCISDPYLKDIYSQTGVISFTDLQKGKKAFEYLKSVKSYFQNN